MLPQAVERPRQQHRHRARARQRGHPLDVGPLQVIGGERLELGRQRRAAAVGELVGVQLHGQPGAARGREHRADLDRREGDALAVAVDRIGQAFAGGLRNELADDQIEVRGPVAVGRNGVGGEQRRGYLDRVLAAERAGNAQHAQLREQVKTIA